MIASLSGLYKIREIKRKRVEKRVEKEKKKRRKRVENSSEDHGKRKKSR